MSTLLREIPLPSYCEYSYASCGLLVCRKWLFIRSFNCGIPISSMYSVVQRLELSKSKASVLTSVSCFLEILK